jgi:hypothetical protein
LAALVCPLGAGKQDDGGGADKRDDHGDQESGVAGARPLCAACA